MLFAIIICIILIIILYLSYTLSLLLVMVIICAHISMKSFYACSQSHYILWFLYQLPIIFMEKNERWYCNFWNNIMQLFKNEDKSLWSTSSLHHESLAFNPFNVPSSSLNTEGCLFSSSRRWLLFILCSWAVGSEASCAPTVLVPYHWQPAVWGGQPHCSDAWHEHSLALQCRSYLHSSLLELSSWSQMLESSLENQRKWCTRVHLHA